jgi:hypothetical protein
LTSFPVFFNEVSADVMRRHIPTGDRAIDLARQPASHKRAILIVYLALLATILGGFSLNAITAASKTFSKKWRLHTSYEMLSLSHACGTNGPCEKSGADAGT